MLRRGEQPQISPLERNCLSPLGTRPRYCPEILDRIGGKKSGFLSSTFCQQRAMFDRRRKVELGPSRDQARITVSSWNMAMMKGRIGWEWRA